MIKTGVLAGAAAMLPWQHAHGELREVARNRTMILVWGGREGRWVDWDLWNPYAIGSNHQNGPNLIYEPLAYYSAFADKTEMWLAESYEFAPDFKRLTIKTRSGISWSDGKPFSAEDVAYTINTLRDIGPKVRWGVDVQQAVEKAAATDANTVAIDFKIPAPRFFFLLTYKYDIGVYIVPKHIHAQPRHRLPGQRFDPGAISRPFGGSGRGRARRLGAAAPLHPAVGLGDPAGLCEPRLADTRRRTQRCGIGRERRGLRLCRALPACRNGLPRRAAGPLPHRAAPRRGLHPIPRGAGSGRPRPRARC